MTLHPDARDRLQEGLVLSYLFVVLSCTYVALSSRWTPLGVVGLLASCVGAAMAVEVVDIALAARARRRERAVVVREHRHVHALRRAA